LREIIIVAEFDKVVDLLTIPASDRGIQNLPFAHLTFDGLASSGQRKS
jgi:hypothetical protein